MDPRNREGMHVGKFVQLKGETGRQSRRGTRVAHAWVEAANVRPGDTLVGNSGKVYAVLGTAYNEDHQVVLTVHTPSGDVRTWVRAPRFSCERA